MRYQTFLFREGKVTYAQEGSGSAVILLHGFMESSRMWEYYIAELSKYFRVVVIDLPGHGNTANFGYVHDMELMAQSVYALIRHLKLRRVHLVGHSMGGYVALAFAELYVDMVKSIVMLNSTSYADSLHRVKERNRAIELLKSGRKDLFIREVIPNLFYRKHKSYHNKIRKYRNMAARTSLRGIIAGLEGMKIRKDRSVILQFAPFPVLFIHGEYDHLIKTEDVHQQLDLSDDIYGFLLEDVGHMSIEESKDKTWVTIKKFVKSGKI